MQEAPKNLSRRVGIIGRRNVGKSSLINALVGQDIAIVSDIPGTTTDPVEKIMELAPLGPIVFIDTAGLDDSGDLGDLRIKRSRRSLHGLDAALLVIDRQNWGQEEIELVQELQKMSIPFAILRNKTEDEEVEKAKDWRPTNLAKEIMVLPISAIKKQGLEQVREVLGKILPDQSCDKPLLYDLLPDNGLLVLVVPIDSGAPKGRLIHPQVQTIRDCLDGNKICLVVKETELSSALSYLKRKPDLLVCDSQIAEVAVAKIPEDLAFTTFSILMARFKGNLEILAKGAATLTHLKSGDKILIQEACTHHAQKDDIGRVKLPRLLTKMSNTDLDFKFSSGRDFSPYSEDYKVIIHCGGCTLTRKQMLDRLHTAQEANCPMTNYGLALTLTKGVMARALQPFPKAYQAYLEEVGESIIK